MSNKMKQETLEQAAERVAYDSTEENKGFPSIKMFIEGAEWQAKRMYSEEEILQLILNCSGSIIQFQIGFNNLKKVK